MTENHSGAELKGLVSGDESRVGETFRCMGSSSEDNVDASSASSEEKIRKLLWTISSPP